jgi:transcriptional regulator with XRE-family HTH domain
MSLSKKRALESAIRTAHLTVKSMASALGMSPSTLRRYRKGEYRVPDELLEAVAALLRYQAERLENKARMLESLMREQGVSIRR